MDLTKCYCPEKRGEQSKQPREWLFMGKLYFIFKTGMRERIRGTFEIKQAIFLKAYS